MRPAGLTLCIILCLGLLCACGDEVGSQPASSRVTDVSITVPMPDAGSVPADDSPPPSLPAVSAPPQAETSSSEPQPQPPPKFTDATPAVSKIEGLTVSVLFKTDVKSTVNCILSTSGSPVSTTQFYDYTRRNKPLDGAVSHTSVFMVDAGGKTGAFTLPNAAKAYYLLFNAAENATGSWQTGVTVLMIFDPVGTAAELSGPPKQQPATAAEYVWLVETLRPTRVYIGVTAAGATAPAAADIKTGGGAFTGSYSVDTAGDKAPYTATLSIPKGNLPAGSYIMWLVCKDLGDDNYPFGAVQKLEFTVA
jgi:hypothetical protein